jgi:hypothetical protein
MEKVEILKAIPCFLFRQASGKMLAKTVTE